MSSFKTSKEIFASPAPEHAQSKRQVADQAVRDRGAIIEALVLDGVTLADIGRQLGVSKQRAGQLLSAYRERVAAE